MTFANPLFVIAGTALIALPIVLHLIMRQKAKHFEFPALRFIRRRHDVNRRRLRLRHLLLLALRTAAILLLALALARPSVKFAGALGSQEAPVAAALVFDTSMRMEYRHQNLTRLETARETALRLLAQLPEGSDVAVLDSRPGPGAFQVDRGAAKHRIELLETVADAEPLTNRLDEALRLLGTSDLVRKEVYVFTDMTRTAWPAGAAAELEARAEGLADLGVYLIDVGVERPVNTALGEIRLSREVLASRSLLRIETEVSHTGPEADRTVELRMQEADGSWQTHGSQTVSLEPGASKAVEFYRQGLDVGTYQGYMEVVGQDGLACDDRRYFTVEVKPPWQILLVAPEPADRYTLHLSEMLAPSTLVRSGKARFLCETIEQDELADHSFDSYAAVCLVDPKPLAPAVWQKLADYVADGHGAGIFLGKNATNSASFNDPKAQELLPAKLLNKLNAPGDYMYLAPEDVQHPILAAFGGLHGTVPWETLAVFRYWQLGKLSPGVDVVVPYSTGRPALLERTLGTGRVITLTTPLSVYPTKDPWNLLPYDEYGTVLILANGIVSYLVGSSEQRLNYAAGDTAVLQVDRDSRYRSYALILLDDPDALEVRLTPDLKAGALVITSTDEPGNYRVRAGGVASGVDRGFSVNLDPRQTALERIDEEGLSEVLGPLPIDVAQSQDDLDQRVSTGRVGRELFPMLILLLAAALGAEHVLANRFYREAATQNRQRESRSGALLARPPLSPKS